MRILLLTSALSLLMLSLQAQDAAGNRDVIPEGTEETTPCILKPGVGVNDLVFQKHSLSKAAREFDSKVEKQRSGGCWGGNWSMYFVESNQLLFVGNSFRKEHKIRVIRTEENSHCRTRQGIELGSTLDRVLAAYGEPLEKDAWEHEGPVFSQRYQYDGLTLYLDRQTEEQPFKVTEIEIFKPSNRKVRVKF